MIKNDTKSERKLIKDLLKEKHIGNQSTYQLQFNN